MALKFPARCKHTTSTSGGAGTPYTLTAGAAPTGYRTLTQAVAQGDLADGDEVSYICIDTGSGGLGALSFEIGRGAYNNTTKTIARTTIYQPNGTAVIWGVGTRDIFIIDNPYVFMAGANNLSDVVSAATSRNNLGLTPAATTVIGSSAGQLIAWAAGPKYPVGDGSLLTNLPAGTPSVPSGTVMPVYQNSVPTGWTAVTTPDDTVMALTNNSGIGGGGPHAAGTTGGLTWDVSFGMVVGSTVLTIAQIPAHDHSYNALSAVINVVAPGGNAQQTFTTGNTGLTGGGGGHTHTLSSPSNWRPPTAYFRLVSKN